MAGSVTVSQAKIGNIQKIVLAVVGDAANGSVPDTVLTSFEGTLLALGTAPGVTQPTALYDITVVDQFGHDVLEGVGANRSATLSEKVPVVYSGTGLHPPVDEADTLTFKLANNSVASAQITVTLYYGLGNGG
jgi:hypothetical protein